MPVPKIYCNLCFTSVMNKKCRGLKQTRNAGALRNGQCHVAYAHMDVVPLPMYECTDVVSNCYPCSPHNSLNNPNDQYVDALRWRKGRAAPGGLGSER